MQKEAGVLKDVPVTQGLYREMYIQHVQQVENEPRFKRTDPIPLVLLVKAL